GQKERHRAHAPSPAQLLRTSISPSQVMYFTRPEPRSPAACRETATLARDVLWRIQPRPRAARALHAGRPAAVISPMLEGMSARLSPLLFLFSAACGHVAPEPLAVPRSDGCEAPHPGEGHSFEVYLAIKQPQGRRPFCPGQ